MFTERQRYSLQKWNDKGKRDWMNNFPVQWVEEADDDDEEKSYIDKEKKYTKYIYILLYTQTHGCILYEE